MKHPLIVVAIAFLLLLSSVEAGDIRGVVLDADDKPVPQATVVLCGQDTGIPLDKKTFKPFVDKGVASKGIATVVTDVDGTFSFEGVPDGKYKLAAQSWPAKPSVLEIFEVNGEQIVLHGVASQISVPSQQASAVRIKPLGKCVVTIDEDFPNNAGFLLIGTKPLSADPILGFVSWRGPFLKNLIGANRMPKGVTKIHGLPKGNIYLSVFALDNNGGIGAGTVETKAGKTVKAEYIPIVCTWSNGRHDPPEELKQTFSQIKKIAAEQNNYLVPFLDGLLTNEGIEVKRDEKANSAVVAYYPYLDQVVTLPSGSQVRFADVLACLEYISLQKVVEMRMKKK